MNLSLLKEKSDLFLIKLIKNHKHPTDALKELTKRHSGIFINMVTLYTPSSSLSIRDELIAEKGYHIYQCALKFDASKKTKFSTHLGNETKWMCLNIYNKNKKRPEISVDEIVTELSDEFSLDNCEKTLDFESFSSIMGIIKNYSDKRIYKIFKLRYIEGYKNKVMPWKMISRNLDMSIQGCINIHDSTILKLQNKLIK